MKNRKYVAFLIMVCMAVVVFGYKNDDGFTIRGKISGAKDGSKVTFNYADIRTGNEAGLGSAIVKDGEFELKGKLTSPRLLSMRLKGAKGTVGTCFFAENTNMTLETSIDDLLDWSQFIGSGSTSKVKITGSGSQNFYSEYIQKTEGFDQQVSLLTKDNLPELYKEKGTGRVDAKMPIAYGIKISKEINALTNDKKNFTMNFVLKNKPSEVLSYIAYNAIYAKDITVPEIDQLVKHISSSTEKGLLTDNFLQIAVKARKSAVGAHFTDFTLNDPQGNPHKISDYAGKGHYVLLEFWASWCGHCRASFPHLKKCYDAYHAKGFDVVAISLDDKTDLWNEAMEKDGVTNLWPQLSDLKAYAGGIPKAYNISGLPMSILLDPDGKVVTRLMRGAWMEEILIDKLGNHFEEK
jgi:thiol-disulfide isomerase/thioredoxin